jgi:peptidyl-prolyl cis-trans isomerase A (cyclophilin A)
MIIVGMLLFAAVSCDDARAQAPPAQPKAAAGSTPTHKPAAASPYDRALLRPALLTAKAPATYQVKFTTTKGDFVMTVTRAWAPLGADRFYNLVRHHFYDNASFFRVLKGFVVQWGISAYPPVMAAWDHAPIKDEPVIQSNKKGFVTYAKGGPNSRATEVFINLRDNNSEPNNLDLMGFTPFGEVTEGMDVIERLYSGYGDGSDMGGKGPLQDTIQKLGKAYLDKDFPNLDSIKTTTLILPPGAVPAKAPATPKGTPPAASGKP